MIEIKHFEPCDKGALKGKISLRIEKWGGFCIHDVGYFEKDGKRWVGFPNRKVKINETEERWLPYMAFDKPDINKKFCEDVLTALEAQWK